MADYTHIFLALGGLSIGIIGTLTGIYVRQEKTNSAQHEINKNIEKRVTHLEMESDGHRDKINDLLLKMNEKISKIYTMLGEIKNK